MAGRIVLTTVGSLGDLHPYLAVGIGLKRRGHEVVLATSGTYRAKVEAEGLAFHAVAPDIEILTADPQAMKRAYDYRTGTEYVIRSLVLPHLRQSYEDLLPVCRGARLVVGHALSYAVPLLAEKHGVRWLSTALAPMAFLSTWDPPVLPRVEWLPRLRGLGRLPYLAVFRLAALQTHAWAAPIRAVRRDLGLPPSSIDPLLEGMFSPHGTMAWFSSLLGAPQPDWPPNPVITGFPFYDRGEPGAGMPAELCAFLDSGPPPVVFTLGSSAVFEAGAFFEESLAAARLAGCRAVLLVGSDPRNRPRDPLPEGVIAAPYAPYSELFPRASAIVHQGGVGTTAQALRSGRPMVIVPYSHDQPDNAARAARLGVSRTLPRRRYTAQAAARELRALLEDGECVARARAAGEQVQSEDGVAAACEFIERACGRQEEWPPMNADERG
jgi:rhamnosyltransferase subunit B